MNNALLEHLKAIHKLELDKCTCEEAKKRLQYENERATSLVANLREESFNKRKPEFEFCQKENTQPPPMRIVDSKNMIKPPPEIEAIFLLPSVLLFIPMIFLTGIYYNDFYGDAFMDKIASLVAALYLLLVIGIPISRKIDSVRKALWTKKNQQLCEKDADEKYALAMEEYNKKLKKFEKKMKKQDTMPNSINSLKP